MRKRETGEGPASQDRILIANKLQMMSEIRENVVTLSSKKLINMQENQIVIYQTEDGQTQTTARERL